jgi:excisionase family DNA binding protein
MKKGPDLGAVPRRAFHMVEASKMLGVSASTIYRHANEGRIKLVKIGGRTLITAAEIDRLVSEGTG